MSGPQAHTRASSGWDPDRDAAVPSWCWRNGGLGALFSAFAAGHYARRAGTGVRGSAAAGLLVGALFGGGLTWMCSTDAAQDRNLTRGFYWSRRAAVAQAAQHEGETETAHYAGPDSEPTDEDTRKYLESLVRYDMPALLPRELRKSMEEEQGRPEGTPGLQ